MGTWNYTRSGDSRVVDITTEGMRSELIREPYCEEVVPRPASYPLAPGIKP